MYVSLMVGIVAVLMILIELARPGRRWPKVAGWWTRAALLNGTQVAAVVLLGGLWEGSPGLFPGHRAGPIGGAVLGYLVITFIYYWWHRLRHENAFLWRWVHQIHHSPVRLEIITSFYKHPLEIFLNSLLSSAILYPLLGLDVATAASVTLLTGLAELYYHWNVKTPHWTGYLFQRPEMHCVHHALDAHRNNYADLPLWDILFGTFDNPKGSDFACGFADDREQQLPAMLIGRDLHTQEGTS